MKIPENISGSHNASSSITLSGIAYFSLRKICTKLNRNYFPTHFHNEQLAGYLHHLSYEYLFFVGYLLLTFFAFFAVGFPIPIIESCTPSPQTNSTPFQFFVTIILFILIKAKFYCPGAYSFQFSSHKFQ